MTLLASWLKHQVVFLPVPCNDPENVNIETESLATRSGAMCLPWFYQSNQRMRSFVDTTTVIASLERARLPGKELLNYLATAKYETAN